MSDQTSLPAHLNPRLSGRRGSSVATRRAGHVLIALVSAVVLLVSVGGWATYSYFSGNVHHVGLNLGDNRPAEKYGVENYLIVGTDSRAGAGDAYGDVPGQRSDTTILAHVAEDGTMTMLSFPRDTLVQIPEYTDSSGRTHARHRDRFNSAISNGGPSLLVSLIEDMTGMRVDHYVSMDLQGFKAITNALGGVDVCVLPSASRQGDWNDAHTKIIYSTNTNDPWSGWVGGPGTVHVNGDQALAFVRQRHGLPEGDIDRIRRQQQFIGAVFHKATSSDVLTNPVKLAALTNSATSALTLDDNTSVADLKSLALQMRGLASGAMHMITLPTHAPTRAEGASDDKGTLPGLGSVQIYNPVDLARIVVPLGGRVNGVEDTAGPSATAPATTEPAVPITLLPSQVTATVSVYNGTHTSGMSTTVAKALVAQGFQAAGGYDADSHDYEDSRVLYGSGLQAQARTVQAAISPGALLRPDFTIKGIHVIVGSKFSSIVTPAKPGSTSQPAATAPATTTPAAPAAPGCTY